MEMTWKRRHNVTPSVQTFGSCMGDNFANNSNSKGSRNIRGQLGRSVIKNKTKKVIKTRLVIFL